MNIEVYEEKIIGGGELTLSEVSALCSIADKEELYALADRVRRHFTGDRFDTCSIINAKSGRCSEDCKWCSQSVFHKCDIEVYPLIPVETALEMARYNASKGIRKFSLVTSGRRLSREDIEKACSIYRALDKEVGIELCASMGLLDHVSLKRLRESGVKNYHCNLESSPSYFKTLCTTHTADDKLETLHAARRAGLNLCSGGIIGMGESFEERIEWALTLRELGVMSIPLNLLNPIKGTRLEDMRPLPDEEILTTFAMFRLVNPRAMIRFAGGRTLISHIQEKALRCGINAALMGDMLTTSGAGIDADLEMISAAGYNI